MSLAVCIVGKSGAGKTTIMVQLIQEFRKRGYKVAAVKHAPEEIDVDLQGKDSWKFAQAGSEVVLASSSEKLAFVENTDHDHSVDEIMRVVGGGFDIVLLEGFKKGKAPKIEVHRKEQGEELVCPEEVLSAVLSDEPLNVGVPQFPLSDIDRVADFIEKEMAPQVEYSASLFVNGKQVFIKAFVRDIIAEALVAMVTTLKDVEEVRDLDISIRNRHG
ncbi:MAG: molybdopterin-guanine dinucleotide biosynthesis protein B [Dehalococcoidia bacterium]|nr:molybdopterin-guanine dinucleotide biosynthesis protein B [Dehalococcoidia bacterium]